MNAASLYLSVPSVPNAATPVSSIRAYGGGGVQSSAAITPIANQGFKSATAQEVAATTQSQADASIPADQGLALFAKVFGDSFGTPIVAADGTVYAPLSSPTKGSTNYELSYVVIGKVDLSKKTILFIDKVLAKLKESVESSGTTRKLVKVDDQWMWQTFAKGEDGSTKVVKVEQASEEDLKAEQERQQQEAAEKAAKEKATNTEDWVTKLGQVSKYTGLFSSVAGFVSSLSRGTDPYTGRPSGSWLQGYMLANRINSVTDAKFLPSWMQDGPIATAIDIGVQAYGMLDMGQDIKNISTWLGTAKPLPSINPDSVKDLVAKGYSAQEASALAEMGVKLRTGQLALVDGRGDTAINLGRSVNKAGEAVELGTTKIPTQQLNDTMRAVDKSPYAGLRAKENIDGGITKGLGALKGLVEPALIGTYAISSVTSSIRLKQFVDKYGVKSLIDTKQGRDAALGAVTSWCYLGLYTLPKLLPQLGLSAVAQNGIGSVVNLAANVVSGVQMLDRYGLFGEEGFLNHDVVRGAFLIPPLTPIGALAFVLKRRKDKRVDEAKKLEAAKQTAKVQINQVQQQVQQQLQQTGSIQGAKQGEDGSITVSTGVPIDLSQLANQITTAKK